MIKSIVFLVVLALSVNSLSIPKYAPSKPGFSSTTTTNNQQSGGNNYLYQQQNQQQQYQQQQYQQQQYQQQQYQQQQNQQQGGITIGGKPYQYLGPELYECEYQGRIIRSERCNTQQSCYSMLQNYRNCNGHVYRTRLQSRY